MNILNIDKLVAEPKIITGTMKNGELLTITIPKVPSIYVLKLAKLEDQKKNLEVIELAIDLLSKESDPRVDRKIIIETFSWEDLGRIFRYLVGVEKGNDKKKEEK
jgi:hypothetical protein